MITRPNVIATPTWPSWCVFASTMIAPHPAKTSAKVPIASAVTARSSSRLMRSRDEVAAALEQQHVAPDAVQLAEPLATADDLEPDTLVQADARLVLREDAGLDRPDPRALGGGDQALEQEATHPLSPCPIVDVE